MVKSRTVIFLFICLLVPLSIKANAASINHISSSMVIYVDGGSIHKIHVEFQFVEDNLSPVVFVLPFNASENNANYDNRALLYSYRYYDGYSICSITPLIQKMECSIEFSNESGVLYTGVSINGTVHNGQSEIKLTIPYIKTIEVPKDSYDYFIAEFDKYYINISQPYSRIKYDEYNRKGLFEEQENNNTVIDYISKEDVVFEFTLNPYYRSEESPMFLIMTVIFIPFLIMLLSIFIPIDDKTKLRLRIKILYGISILSPFAIVPICIANKLEFWIYIVLIVLYLAIYALIISNCISYISSFGERVKKFILSKIG